MIDDSTHSNKVYARHGKAVLTYFRDSKSIILHSHSIKDAQATLDELSQYASTQKKAKS